jgi:uncharacterized membrane protein YhaH (DUF805 family)
MGLVEAVRTCIEKYATFSGRARRAEYWWFVLACTIGGALMNVIDALVFGVTVMPSPELAESASSMEMDLYYFVPSIFGSVFWLALIIPSISVSVRRLHDLDKSGWWWWLWLLPLIGWIIMLIWYLGRGTVGPNAYGPDPIGAEG